MKLVDFYNFLKDIEKELGCGCQASVYISGYSLVVQIAWPDDDLKWKKHYDVTGLEDQFPDAWYIKTWIIQEAEYTYKMKTVGED